APGTKAPSTTSIPRTVSASLSRTLGDMIHLSYAFNQSYRGLETSKRSCKDSIRGSLRGRDHAHTAAHPATTRCLGCDSKRSVCQLHSNCCIPIAAFHYLTQIRTLGWKPNTAVPAQRLVLTFVTYVRSGLESDDLHHPDS